MTGFAPLAQRKNDSAVYERAKTLRRLPSPAERILWHALRQLPKTVPKFRRQHPLQPYIVDFICLKAQLVIEIDGFSYEMRCAQDRQRDRYLAELGYDVMRFANADVYQNCEGVVLTILARIHERTEGCAALLPQGGGE